MTINEAEMDQVKAGVFILMNSEKNNRKKRRKAFIDEGELSEIRTSSENSPMAEISLVAAVLHKDLPITELLHVVAGPSSFTPSPSSPEIIDLDEEKRKNASRKRGLTDLPKTMMTKRECSL
ncbi:hypothetical protein QVD17_08285 [Tagetes erecta]|uniref:Uncharacterized protein n=1 Tax=Tagetes erecta TaxID=13708 RepID=A0AAD8P4H1_TARER|nr:hypothetical protein QVD17_08285 [Tagetes erecta]